ncbi:MAG: glycosyltransferase family 2 protein [Geobacteraceae bacterium]|jgi:glycosyltransferase involved in cell wall biosynthesis
MNISATIITLNEEKNIGACLKSLDFADEIVVVDSGSTDRTKEICLAHPSVNFQEHTWEGFGRQKNVAADLAVNDWILNIDADERVTPQLRESICSADLSAYGGFKIPRENYFGNRWIKYCGWYPDYNLRLYNRKKGRFSERDVHESVICQSAIGILSGNLLHYSYEGMTDFIARINRYTSLSAAEIANAGKKPGLGSMLLRPLYTFFKMYFLKAGFLEGYAGLILSILFAQYTFLKYAKARELKKDIFKAS